jgi:glycosyltransferase involved in cell wall biosynthesis
MSDTTIGIASINTKMALQLCLKSLWEFTDRDAVRIVVGDCGSTDGTLPMLTRYLKAGRIDDLEVAAHGRQHAEWINHWVATCGTSYLVLMDSDIELRRDWWLSRLRAGIDGAVFAAASMYPAQPDWAPAGGGPGREISERPSVHLMMLDVAKARELGTSFEPWTEYGPDLRNGERWYDVGGDFLRAIKGQGLPYSVMPDDYYLGYRHWAGVSWQRQRQHLSGHRIERARNMLKVDIRLGALSLPKPLNRRALNTLSRRPSN